jgi:hypothetical protein
LGVSIQNLASDALDRRCQDVELLQHFVQLGEYVFSARGIATAVRPNGWIGTVHD